MSSPPHVIIEGVYKNIPITIFGEEHNNIDNSIYERMDLNDKIIMVEHSTILSELKKGEEKLFTCAKGLDWVWFTRTKNKQPVICIDNRLENGFYNSQEEIDIRSFIDNPDIHPLLFLEVTDRIMQSIRKIKEKFKPIEEVFKKLVRTTSTQINKIIELNKNNNERDYQNEENLIENLLKLSSLSVDMNIIIEIEKYVDASKLHLEIKPVFIFVGIAHALRLKEILNLNLNPASSDIEPYFKSSLDYIYTGGYNKKKTFRKKTLNKTLKNKRRKTFRKKTFRKSLNKTLKNKRLNKKRH
jgi:hypothetical protein